MRTVGLCTASWTVTIAIVYHDAGRGERDVTPPKGHDMGGLEEWRLMARGVVALVWKSSNVQPLVDADHKRELSQNVQLAQAPLEKQEQHRRGYVSTLNRRIQLLRRNHIWSFVLMGSAVIVALIFSHFTWSPTPVTRVWFGVASVFCFAWATLARIGWAGQSWKGDTVVERLDELIFKLLYWLATLLGTLALV